MEGPWGSSGMCEPLWNWHRKSRRTHGTCSMSTDPESRRGFGPYLEGVGPTFIDAEGVLTTIRFGVLEDLERALSVHGQNVAGFLVEPIQGEAGYFLLFLLSFDVYSFNFTIALLSHLKGT